ncbi:hypothetical protein [Gloeothece verrucosa]|uniref:NERD domain-containing protein n=1 Tax=Gloeothece verrucosa (strain PCC 7822) TaxID=497965 RepID=E0UA67_GLOV7|nr:hypothetical protein [Gloeothece verrucosa]ADN17372.1 conserved hypothetical protein [Gloeothece verrucosa PCC 7822]
MVKADLPLRYMGQNRQNKAWVYFWAAVFLAIIPIIHYLFLRITDLSIFICVSCWVSAILIIRRAEKLKRFAQIATEGAKADSEMALLLDHLAYSGWKIEYNIPVSYLGNAEVFLRSPQGRCFVINVQEDAESIFYDGSRLLAVYGQSVYGQDMLDLVKQQAEYLKNNRGVRSVTPIICATKARLEMGDTQIQNVYVIKKNVLVSLLKKLG